MAKRKTDYSQIPFEDVPETLKDFELAQKLYLESYCYTDWCGMMSYHGLKRTQNILKWVNEQGKLEHAVN